MTARDYVPTRLFGVDNRLATVVLVLAVGLGMSQATLATPITIDVPGYSFEAPGTSGWVAGAAAGWWGSSGAGYQNASGSQGWSIAGIDGTQTGYVNSWAGPSVLVSAAALTTVQEGYTYLLTVGVGARSAGDPTSAYQLSLTSGSGQVFATTGTVDASGISAGTMVDKTLSFFATAGNAAIGQGLYVALWNPMPGGANTQVNFDNIRLTATSNVPEPGTISLLVTGALALLSYAWRNRM